MSALWCQSVYSCGFGINESIRMRIFKKRFDGWTNETAAAKQVGQVYSSMRKVAIAGSGQREEKTVQKNKLYEENETQLNKLNTNFKKGYIYQFFICAAQDRIGLKNSKELKEKQTIV